MSKPAVTDGINQTNLARLAAADAPLPAEIDAVLPTAATSMRSRQTSRASSPASCSRAVHAPSWSSDRGGRRS